MIFEHTFKEPGMWRGWLRNGQAVELSVSRHGWAFDAGVHIHGNDDDRGNRILILKFWRWTAVIPLGIVDHPWPPFESPQWSVSASSEFGLWLRWGMRSNRFDWPWMLHTVAYEQQMPDGSWSEVLYGSDDPYQEEHPYTYVRRSGEVQNRTATISKRRHVLTWVGLRKLPWPRWNRESIEVQFSDEVGERSGSWKGGCIGCAYDLLPGETMEQSLRRMERDRKF